MKNLLGWVCAAGLAAGSLLATEPESWLIVGARVADGTGKPSIAQDVRIQGDRILEVGRLTPAPGERVVDGKGLVLSPGFIDVHNHSEDGLVTDPLAETQVSQGITTLVLGPDGGSPWPIAEYLQARRDSPPAVNVMTMVGHATVRELVMGKDFRRQATPGEIAKMAALVEQGMREGAAGLSSGLEYDVGSYASTEELDRAREGRGAGRRLLHDARPRRGGEDVFRLRGGGRDLREGGSAPGDLAHQARDRRRVGPDAGGPSSSSRRRGPAASTPRPTATPTRPGTRTSRSSSPTSSTTIRRASPRRSASWAGPRGSP